MVGEGASGASPLGMELTDHQMAHEMLHWDRPFHTVRAGGFETGDIVWFPEGGLNASYNCVDRWAFKHPDKVFLLARSLPNVSLRAPARRGPGRTAGRRSECDFRRVYAPMI